MHPSNVSTQRAVSSELTAVSEVTEKLWAEYEAFCARDLSEFEVLYLFVDGVAERLHRASALPDHPPQGHPHHESP
jgi:hypothetical protein